MRPRRRPEVIAGVVNADGTVARGAGFTVSAQGAGVYVITLPQGFRLAGATATAATGSSTHDAAVSTPAGLGERTFQVITYPTAGGASVNSAFSFVAVALP